MLAQTGTDQTNGCTVKAEDFHDLLSCHEAEAMVLSAEMQFKGASMRKESRGWFLREDYPQMDNENWLKWIVCENDNGANEILHRGCAD